MALLAGSMTAASIQSHGGSSMASEGFINGEETEEQEAAAGDMGAGGVAAAAAAAAASAGERRTAADGGEIWVEPAVVVKKYNKVRREGMRQECPLGMGADGFKQTIQLQQGEHQQCGNFFACFSHV